MNIKFYMIGNVISLHCTLKGRINTTDVWSGGRCGCNRHRSSCYEVQLVSCSANRRALTHGVYVVATTTYRTLVVQKGYKDVTTDAYGSIWLQSAPSRKKKRFWLQYLLIKEEQNDSHEFNLLLDVFRVPKNGGDDQQ